MQGRNSVTISFTLDNKFAKKSDKVIEYMEHEHHYELDGKSMGFGFMDLEFSPKIFEIQDWSEVHDKVRKLTKAPIVEMHFGE